MVVHDGFWNRDLPVACLPWPSRAHLAAADPEFEKLTLDEQNARIVDLSLAVLRGLGAEAEETAGPLGSVLLAHGAIAGSAVGAAGSTQFFREPVLPLSELRGLPFRAQCWGHLHRAQQPYNRIAYAGSIERTDFAEAAEDKGWWLLELHEDWQEDSCEWRTSSPRSFADLDLAEPAAWEAEISSLDGSLAGAIVRVRYEATPEEARTVDHTGIRRALYAVGALKVHGPIATLRHTVAERESTLSEETDALTGWEEYADGQGLMGVQRERLDRLVRQALEVVAP
jgi:DNA repair exonuclease SbcCD nuclease subunit